MKTMDAEEEDCVVPGFAVNPGKRGVVWGRGEQRVMPLLESLWVVPVELTGGFRAWALSRQLCCRERAFFFFNFSFFFCIAYSLRIYYNFGIR